MLLEAFTPILMGENASIFKEAERQLERSQGRKPTGPTAAEKFNNCRFADDNGQVIELLTLVCTDSTVITSYLLFRCHAVGAVLLCDTGTLKPTCCNHGSSLRTLTLPRS